MVNIEVEIEKNQIVRISANGHAGYAKKGLDIVCSAISSVIAGGFNAIKGEHECEAKVGNASFKKVGKLSLHDQIVLETIVVQLLSIEQSYPKYLKVKFI